MRGFQPQYIDTVWRWPCLSTFSQISVIDSFQTIESPLFADESVVCMHQNSRNCLAELKDWNHHLISIVCSNISDLKLRMQQNTPFDQINSVSLSFLLSSVSFCWLLCSIEKLNKLIYLLLLLFIRLFIDAFMGKAREKEVNWMNSEYFS